MDRSKLLIFFAGLCVIVLLGLSLIPYSSVTVPEWRIEVVDQKRNPVPNRRVIQSWMHSTFESANSSHEEDRYTDAFGVVLFPERRVEASPINRGWGKLKEKIDFLPHTSYGAHSFVFVDGPSEGGLTFQGGDLPGHIIVVKD